MSRTESSGARISPQDVRRKHFSVRLRGVDYGEVRFFLAGLADELEGLQAQLATLTQENQALGAEVAEARADLQEAQADTEGTGHRPGRERPQPGPAARRLVDR